MGLFILTFYINLSNYFKLNLRLFIILVFFNWKVKKHSLNCNSYFNKKIYFSTHFENNHNLIILVKFKNVKTNNYDNKKHFFS